MIGLILRTFVGGFLPDTGLIAVIFGSALACCALCGIYKCSHFRMRDCSCIKRCMRASGADKFDDFELVVLVHEALYTSNKGKMHSAVRITAGCHVVQTDENSKGIFQQPLAVFVEQGTESVNVELLDSRERKVVAVLKLDVMKDILGSKGEHAPETIYPMKQKHKGVVNPRVKLTLRLDTGDDAERALLSGIMVSAEADLMLRKQLDKVANEVAGEDRSQDAAAAAIPISELDLVARGCCGPLDMYGSWGSREQVFVKVRGPPDSRRYALCIFKDEQECLRNQRPKEEVELLKILSVQPDTTRSDVFHVHYLQTEKVKRRLTFRRIDRARDVWVEMLQLMIKLLREAKERRKLAANKV